MSDARELVNKQLKQLKAKGLKGISLYPSDDAAAKPDEFYAELGRLLEAIENNIGEPLKFNDSRKRE